MTDRTYRALVEITYLGGTLPREAGEALGAALRAAAGPVLALGMTLSPQPHTVVTISARLRGPAPLDVLAALSAAVDRALLGAGLFEEFDVTGKVLRVAPLELAARIAEPPYGEEP